MINGMDNYELTINGLHEVSCDTLTTLTISNSEFNTLDGILTNITIQAQLDDLKGGNIPYINPDTITTNLIEINGGPTVADSYPLEMNDGTIQYFRLSKTGVVYCTGLYINGVYIDYPSIVYTSYLTTFMTAYPTLAGTNVFTGTSNTFNNNILCLNYRGNGAVLFGNPSSATTNMMTGIIIGSTSPYSEHTNNPTGGCSSIQIQTKRTGAITLGNNTVNANMSINLYSGLNSISIGGGSTGTSGSIYIGSRVGTYFNNIYIANSDTVSNQVFLGSVVSTIQIFGQTSFSNYLPSTNITDNYYFTDSNFTTKLFTDTTYSKLTDLAIVQNDIYNLNTAVADIQTSQASVIKSNENNVYTGTSFNDFFNFPRVIGTAQIYPTSDTMLVNKRYVDTYYLSTGNAASTYLSKLYGNTITGINTFEDFTVFNNDITLNYNIQANSATITPTVLSYISTLTSDVQYQIDMFSMYAQTNFALTAFTDRANTFSYGNTFDGITFLNNSIKVNTITISKSQVSYLANLTSDIQSQLDGKPSHNTNNTWTQDNFFSPVNSISSTRIGGGLLNIGTSAVHNMSFGYNLTSLTSGTYNVAIGNDVLTATTNASQNIGIGNMAGKLIAGNSNANICIGFISGYAMTSGSYNSFIGVGAGAAVKTALRSFILGSQNCEQSLVTGGALNFNYNISMGSLSMNRISSNLQFNTSIGVSALGSPVSSIYDLAGSNNTALGGFAGFGISNNSLSSNNTFIGYNCGPVDAASTLNAGASSTTPITYQLSNCICIGSNARGTTSNSINFPSDILNTYLPGTVQIANKVKIQSASPTLITATAVLAFPLFQYYSINISVAISITLPLITADNVGTQICFRKVAGSGTVVVTFLPTSPQLCYTTANGSTLTMASGIYILKVVSMYVSATTFIWAQV